ncbi:MAG TPA: RDD family protein [Bacillota bacterium]|nr:RDD family protein [Bacillota bacterium]
MSGVLNTINSSLRLRRLAAFLIDLAAVGIILSVLYAVTGAPDFPAVASEMKRANMAANSSQAQEITRNMMSLFNTAYLQALLVWFCYEVLTLIIFGGSTPGKLAMRLRLVPADGKRGRLAGRLLMVLRSFLKVLMLFLFQGFPFLLSVLYIFMDGESRTGYDRIARLTVKDRERIGGDLIENV